MSAAGGFPVARCVPCGKDVLTTLVRSEGEDRRSCVHCDAEIDPLEVRWIAEASLDQLGYAERAEPGSACGRGSCGRGSAAIA